MKHGQTVKPDCRAEVLFGQEHFDTHPFGWLFPLNEEQIDPRALAALSRHGGPMDEGNGNVNLSNTPAIFTSFGQFIVHDVTLMCPDFKLGEDIMIDVDLDALATEDDCCAPCAPILVRNGRNPLLDLDAVFGGGPNFNPRLSGANNQLRLNAGCGDIIRNMGGDTRLINNVRNEENLILVQIHVLFMRFYNLLIGFGFSYASARQVVTEIYHAIIRSDYLPTVCDPAVVDWVEANRYPLYQWMLRSKPAIPIQYSLFVFFNQSIKRRNHYV